jgi:PilZ domain
MRKPLSKRLQMIEKDRRASQRFKAKPGSVVFYVEGAGAIRDLSMDGVFILDSEPLPVGTTITFSLMLGNKTVSFQGSVRRSVAGEGMGIQFTEMPFEGRRRLLSQIASLP